MDKPPNINAPVNTISSSRASLHRQTGDSPRSPTQYNRSNPNTSANAENTSNALLKDTFLQPKYREFLEKLPYVTKKVDIYYETFDDKYVVNREPIPRCGGRFNMGIYEGYVIKTDQKIAVKKISINETSATLKYLVREISILQTIKHPYLIEYIDCLRDKQYVYIITAMIQGGCLTLLVKPISERNVMPIIYQIFEALYYLHAHKISHRDIKPDNIMWNSNKKCIHIIDFGLSSQDDHNMKVTRCGTLLYMAPEVMLGKTYDEKADIYPVGVIMFELLFGKNPYIENINHASMHADQQLRKLIQQDIVIPANVVSPECADFLQRILRIDPNKRMGYDAGNGRIAIRDHPWYQMARRAVEEKRVDCSRSILLHTCNDFTMDTQFGMSNDSSALAFESASDHSPRDGRDDSGISPIEIGSPLANCVENYMSPRIDTSTSGRSEGYMNQSDARNRRRTHAQTVPQMRHQFSSPPSVTSEQRIYAADSSTGESVSPLDRIQEDYGMNPSSPIIRCKPPTDFHRDSTITNNIWDGIRVSWDMMSRYSLRDLKTI